jgi:hypothetical protein
MPRRVKVERIDSLAASVEGLQFRWMTIGGIALRQNLRAAEGSTPCGNRIRRPSAAFAPQRFLQGDVLGIQMAIDVGRRLIRKRRAHVVGHARDFTLGPNGSIEDYEVFLTPGRNTLQTASCVSM